MLSSVFSLIPVFGVVGVGIASPIIYERVSSKNFTTSWNKKLEQASYLLGSCEKQSNTKKYNIQLYLSNDDSEGGEYNRGLGLTVFVKANDEKLLEGWSLKGSFGGVVAQLEISPQTIDSGVEWNEWNDFNNNCSMENIISSGNSTHELKEYDINFVCEEKESSFGKKTCDVQFAKENNFAFKENLKPKLKFWAF